MPHTISIELEAPRELEALLDMLSDHTDTLNGIERPRPVNARIELTVKDSGQE